MPLVSVGRPAPERAPSSAATQVCHPAAKLGAPYRSSKVWVRISSEPSAMGRISQWRTSRSQVKAKTLGGSSAVMTPGLSGGKSNSILPPTRSSSRTELGNHLASWAGSVSARHTFSGGCASRRSIRRTLRPSAVLRVSFMRCSSSSYGRAAPGWPR